MQGKMPDDLLWQYQELHQRLGSAYLQAVQAQRTLANAIGELYEAFRIGDHYHFHLDQNKSEEP